MSITATNTVKTKTISDMRLYDDPEHLPAAYTFVSEDRDQLGRASIDDIYKSFEYNYSPTYEQFYCNVSLVGRKLFYPTICQLQCDDFIKWRVMFLNQKNRTAATKFYVKDQSGYMLSAQMLTLSDGYDYTTLDWLSPVDGYLSVNNAVADIDVLLRGYVGGYPDVKPYTFASADIEDVGDAYRYARIAGSYSFAYSKLTAVNLPQLETIGYGAFRGTLITDVDFPHTTYVDKYAFSGCGQLISVYLPNAEEVGIGAFSSCNKLTSVYLPKAEYVGGRLFHSSKALVRAELPKASWTVDDAIAGPKCGQYMFYNNNELTAVSLSAVECFSQQMFYNCKKLESVSCDWNAARLIDARAFYDCEKLAQLGSMSNVVSVDTQAFYSCSKLTSISLPGCLSTNTNVFYDCTSLVSVDMHNLTFVGGSTFENCRSLLSIDLPNLIEIKGSDLFKNCRSVRHIDIHSADLQSIPTNAFYYCSSLSSLALPPLTSIEKIGTGAFSHCNRLSIDTWHGVLSVLSCAFQYGCTGHRLQYGRYMRNVMSFPNARYFAPSAFYESYVQELTCWEVSSIGAKAFAESGLQEIHFNNSNNKVPSCPATAFDNIFQTVQVYVPDSMLTAFKNNTNWKAMTTAKTYNDEYDTEGHYKIELIGY